MFLHGDIKHIANNVEVWSQNKFTRKERVNQQKKVAKNLKFYALHMLMNVIQFDFSSGQLPHICYINMHVLYINIFSF